MSDIVAHNFDFSIKADIKLQESGVTRLSLRGCAKLGGVSPSLLVRAFSSDDNLTSKLAGHLIWRGIEPDDILSFPKEGVPDYAVPFILEYYSYYANQKSAIAAKSSAFLCAVGARTVFQEMVGYKENSTEMEKLASQCQVLLQENDRMRKQLTVLIDRVNFVATGKPSKIPSEPRRLKEICTDLDLMGSENSQENIALLSKLALDIRAARKRGQLNADVISTGQNNLYCHGRELTNFIKGWLKKNNQS